MTFIVLAAVAAIAIFIATGFTKIKENRGWKVNPKQWLTLLSVLIALGAFFTIIPANSAGVVFSPFSGGIQKQVLDEGIKTKGPFDEIYTLSTEVQTSRIENLYGQTKDAQYLTISIDVKYYIDKAQAVSVFQKFRSLSNVSSSLVHPASQRAIETAMTKYNIIEILGDERTQVYAEIEAFLSERFSKDGITFHSITFLDTDGGDEIEQAIRNEAVAKKAVETAEQERTKAEVEAETRIIKATAEAKEKEILAAAIAKSPEVLELEWIKKWSGVLPIYMGGDSGGVMLDLTKLQEVTSQAAATAPTATQAPEPTPEADKESEQ